MPIYEYECIKCGKRFERYRGLNMRKMMCECPDCKFPSKLVVSAPALEDNRGTKLRKKLDKKKTPEGLG